MKTSAKLETKGLATKKKHNNTEGTSEKLDRKSKP